MLCSLTEEHIDIQLHFIVSLWQTVFCLIHFSAVWNTRGHLSHHFLHFKEFWPPGWKCWTLNVSSQVVQTLWAPAANNTKDKHCSLFFFLEGHIWARERETERERENKLHQHITSFSLHIFEHWHTERTKQTRHRCGEKTALSLFLGFCLRSSAVLIFWESGPIRPDAILIHLVYVIQCGMEYFLRQSKHTSTNLCVHV